MSRASRARAIAQAAAMGGAGLVGAGGATYALLRGQTEVARRRIGPVDLPPPCPDGRYGDVVGEPLRLVVLGDSGAAGFGVDAPSQTTGAVIARSLSHAIGRPVQLLSVAVVGAQSGDLAGQLDLALAERPHAAVIMVGANDVTHRVTPGRSVAHLSHAVARLREVDAEVVVGTCPDLGTVRPIPHPLRLIARRWSRSIAAAQTVAVVEAGGRTVALADLLGPEFDAHPDRMFGPDRFHPSAAGYAAVASVIVPSLVAALGGEEPPAAPAGSVLAVEQAAAAAAEVAGTEVAGTGQGPGPGRRGRLTLPAALRRRERDPLPQVTTHSARSTAG
jgi:lysophospholipase L1-like esterase